MGYREDALSSRLVVGYRGGSWRREDQSILDALNRSMSVLLNEEMRNAWPFGLSRNTALNRSHYNTLLPCLEDKAGTLGGSTRLSLGPLGGIRDFQDATLILGAQCPFL